MLEAHALQVKESDIRPLQQAQAVLRRALLPDLPGASWCVAGSVGLNDALRPSLAGELDIDCFLTIPSGRATKNAVARMSDGLIDVCVAHGWRLTTKALGYRITVQDVPSLTIDLSLLSQTRSRTQRLDPTGRTIDETNVLKKSDELAQFMADPLLHCAWLNFKLWAKTSLPWRLRPSSHVLRSIALEHARTNGPHSIGPGWKGYVHWTRSMCDRLECGQFLREIAQGYPVSRPGGSLLTSFLQRLRVYADSIADMTARENLEQNRVKRNANHPIQVFVSSRQREFAALRHQLMSTPADDFRFLLAETFFPWKQFTSDGMRLCDVEVDKADFFIGIYGSEYGSRSPNRSGSPIEEELKRARSRLPPSKVLLFSRAGSRAESTLERLLRRSDGLINAMFEDTDAAANQLLSCVAAAAKRHPC